MELLRDLAARSWAQEKGIDSPFLTPEEYSDYLRHQAEFQFANPLVYEDITERKLIHFGEGRADIRILRIRNLSVSFVSLGHSDYLGALMALGIERHMLGDIRIASDAAFVYAKPQVLALAVLELKEVGRARVEVACVDDLPDGLRPQYIREELIVSSLRLDRFVATCFKCSRTVAAEWIENGRVFVDGRQEQRVDYTIIQGERISVRRQGKCCFHSIKGMSKKNSYILNIDRYS